VANVNNQKEHNDDKRRKRGRKGKERKRKGDYLGLEGLASGHHFSLEFLDVLLNNCINEKKLG